MIEAVEILIGDRPSSRCVRQQDDAMDEWSRCDGAQGSWMCWMEVLLELLKQQALCFEKYDFQRRAPYGEVTKELHVAADRRWSLRSDLTRGRDIHRRPDRRCNIFCFCRPHKTKTNPITMSRPPWRPPSHHTMTIFPLCYGHENTSSDSYSPLLPILIDR